LMIWLEATTLLRLHAEAESRNEQGTLMMWHEARIRRSIRILGVKLCKCYNLPYSSSSTQIAGLIRLKYRVITSRTQPSLVTFSTLPLVSLSSKLCPENPLSHGIFEIPVLGTEDHSVGGCRYVPRNFSISWPHAPCSGLRVIIVSPALVHVTEDQICSHSVQKV
jgi:hypothetical protein